MKSSELKASSVARNDAPPIEVDHHRKHRPLEHDEADPKPALRTAEANGFVILGQPHRKPKHFEILGRDAAGDLVELHIELDGTLRKTRPVATTDPKWTADIQDGE